MKKILANSLVLFVAALVIVGIFSCTVNDQEPISLVSKEDVTLENMLDYIGELGLDTKNYYMDTEVIRVEGDIEFSLDSLRKDISESTGKAYKYATRVVSSNRITNVKVYCQSSVPNQWETAVFEAVDEWNALPGTTIHFSFVSSGQDITVKYGNLGGNTVASANWPSSTGAPGKTLTIDDSYGYYSVGRKREVMAHELGHTIGFAHNDGSSNTTTSFISGSIDNEGDTSIMHPYTHDWNNGFSGGDIIGAQQLYPPTGPYVEVCETAYFGGTRYIIEQYHWVNTDELNKLGLNDNIASVIVHNGARVRLWKNSHFYGTSLYVTKNENLLSKYSFNDVTSSISW